MSAEGVAAVLAVVIGLATLGFGLHTYRQNARSTRLTHMHTLFGAYLDRMLNLQLARDAGQPVSEAEGLLSAFKMYTLEEMWLWLENERRLRPRGSWRRVRKDHDRLVTGWENTILHHIGQGKPRELLDFLRARKCYSPGFVALVSRHHPCSWRKRPPALRVAEPDSPLR